jgi:hypothetical protein
LNAFVVFKRTLSLLIFFWYEVILIFVYFSCNCEGFFLLTLEFLSASSDWTYLICSSIITSWLFSCSNLCVNSSTSLYSLIDSGSYAPPTAP